jgi:hypothetical protein
MPGRDVGLLSPTTRPNHCRTLDPRLDWNIYVGLLENEFTDI